MKVLVEQQQQERTKQGAFIYSNDALRNVERHAHNKVTNANQHSPHITKGVFAATEMHWNGTVLLLHSSGFYPDTRWAHYAPVKNGGFVKGLDQNSPLIFHRVIYILNKTPPPHFYWAIDEA